MPYLTYVRLRTAVSRHICGQSYENFPKRQNEPQHIATEHTAGCASEKS